MCGNRLPTFSFGSHNDSCYSIIWLLSDSLQCIVNIWRQRMTVEKVLGFLVLVGFFVSGCASPGLNKKDYYDRLERTELGMTKSEFKQIFPESIPRGAKQYSKGSVEVLEVAYAYYSFLPTGNRNRNKWTGMEGQSQWFYFYNGKLLQYGNPEDWPSEPDLIIEKRIR